METGIMTWDFASDTNPDLVICGIGDYPTKEALAAIDLAKKEMPSIKIRFVNVSSLTSRGFGVEKRWLDESEFIKQFTADKPVICNFHGYPETMKAIFFDYQGDSARFDIRGYLECGSTTTPFDMHVRNKTSRFDLVIAIFEKLSDAGRINPTEATAIIDKYYRKISENTEYIKIHGIDLPEIDEWQWGGLDADQKAALIASAHDVSDA
jgi:xylulose-5-phosphate/fructose-6-phosphate phosphoketolase